MAEELAPRRLLGVDEAVVVALEEEVAAADGDDAVEHVLVQLPAAIADDLTAPVRRLAAEDHEVAAMQVGLHARPVDDRVGRGAAELARGEEVPGRRRHGNDHEEGCRAERSPHDRYWAATTVS